MANKKELAEKINPFELMDRADEKQILAELRGEIINEYVYSFKQDGREITGLSKVGVDNACREAGNKGQFFRVIDFPQVKDDGLYINVMIKVGRFTLDSKGQEIMIDNTIGAKRQAKNFSPGTPNPFFYESALSKAERNAKRKLLPEKLITAIIKEYKKAGKVQELQPEKPTQPNPKNRFLSPKESEYWDKMMKSHLLTERERTELQTFETYDDKKRALERWWGKGFEDGERDRRAKAEKETETSKPEPKEPEEEPVTLLELTALASQIWGSETNMEELR